MCTPYTGFKGFYDDNDEDESFSVHNNREFIDDKHD
jgi:hypothetical protein